jgi:periplasmic divalent cation tolerance protein
MTDKIVVLTTCGSQEHADKLARHLVDQRVAACVNVLPKARSIYRWKEKVEEASEWMLIIKSRRDLFAALRIEIQKLHTYEIPELIALPVVDGSEPYLVWFDAQLTAKAE